MYSSGSIVNYGTISSNTFGCVWEHSGDIDNYYTLDSTNIQFTCDVLVHHFDVFMLSDDFTSRINNLTVLGGRVKGFSNFVGNFYLMGGVLDIGWENAAVLDITGNYFSTDNSTVIISVYNSTSYDSIKVVNSLSFLRNK